MEPWQRACCVLDEPLKWSKESWVQVQRGSWVLQGGYYSLKLNLPYMCSMQEIISFWSFTSFDSLSHEEHSHCCCLTSSSHPAALSSVSLNSFPSFPRHLDVLCGGRWLTISCSAGWWLGWEWPETLRYNIIVILRHAWDCGATFSSHNLATLTSLRESAVTTAASSHLFFAHN